MVWYWWIPECYTDLFTFRNWDCAPEPLLPFIPNDFLGQVKTSIFSRKGKKSPHFMALIASNVQWLVAFFLLSSAFWYPDIPHCPFGQFLSQTKLLFYSDIATVCQRAAKCHWLQLLLCGAFPKATDLASLTNVNLIHSHCPAAINRGNVCWSELTILCFIALWAAFQSFPQVYAWCCTVLEPFLWHILLPQILYSPIMKENMERNLGLSLPS